MRLTKRAIAAIVPDATRDKCIWDDEVRGFGLRIKPTGVRSFIVQYRNSSRVSRRLTLGKVGVLTVEEARTLAKRALADVIKGGDPAEKRSEERKAMTVRQLCHAYVEAAEKGLILGKQGRKKSHRRFTLTAGGSCGTSCRFSATARCATSPHQTSSASCGAWRPEKLLGTLRRASVVARS